MCPRASAFNPIREHARIGQLRQKGGAAAFGSPAGILDGVFVRQHDVAISKSLSHYVRNETSIGCSGQYKATDRPFTSFYPRAIPCFTSSISFRQLLISEDGPAAVEYAVMLSLILVACIAIVTTLGQSMSSTFSTVNGSVAGS